MQRLIVVLLFIFFSHTTVAASQCNLKGNNYFSIQFNVIGDPNNEQEVYITNNGGKITEILWYTGEEKNDAKTPYIFNEQSLIDGVEYQVKIINDNINDVAKYYLRRATYGNDGWVLISQSYQGVHQGNINIFSSDNNMDLICDESQVEPESPIPFDRCEYFPQPVQSWITEGSSDYSDFPQSVLDVKNSSTEINGWSQAYVNYPSNTYQYTQSWQGGSSWNTLRIGFDLVSDPYLAYENPNSKLCNGEMGCYPGDGDGMINLRKAPPPTPLSVEYTSTVDLKITPDNYATICDGKLCSIIKNSDELIIRINQDLNSLDVQEGSFGKKVKIIFSGDRLIKLIHVDDEVYLYFNRFSNVIFDTVFFDGSIGNIIFESSVKLNVTGVFNSALIVLNFSYIDDVEDFTFPIIYGPQATINIKSPDGTSLKSFILGKIVQFDNPTTVEGSITANHLIVNSKLTLVPLDGTPDCWTETDGDDANYYLSISPTESYSLICEPERVALQVLNDQGQATGSFTGSINIEANNATLTLIKGSGSNGSYTADSNGQLWFDLASSVSQKVEVSGTLNPKGNSSTVKGIYHFVPYKLSASDLYVIANKPQTVEVKALACDDNGGVVDINYGGTPTVSSAWVAPTSGAGELTFAPAFTQGVASNELTMEDSGIKTVTMADNDFDCSGLSECPVEGSGVLKGSFTVYSRPWTFAICSPDNNAMDGNITDAASEKFTVAGDTFALNIRPLRWVDGVNDNSSPQAGGSAIETSAYCSSAVTQNFFSDQSQLAALVVLSHQVAQPAEGNDGTFNGTLEQLNTTGGNSTYLPFSGLSWSEVGVLRVNADISGTYLEMKVNQGYREIGRFSPDHLALISNDWDYADGHTGFVYMNQTIPYRFIVEAQNLQNEATTNYSAFSEALIADIKLLAVDSQGEELGDRIQDYDLQFWDGSGVGAWSGALLSLNSNNAFTFLKQQQSASPYTTSVDGPYQSGFGLRVTDKVDGVDFVSPDLELKASTTLLDTGKRFTTQPDIRYGRMALKDVGGTSVSTINIPLRVEYWQGSRFVTNSDDSGSHFATPDDYICRQTVWSQAHSSANATLSGADTSSSWTKVASGQSSALFAKPASSDESVNDRQQIRFWLRLDDDTSNASDGTRSPQVGETGVTCGAQYTSQPWLQYNWRDKGDEDPSAVVTFGIHRGNDKVIFRGETRLTGQ